MSATPRSWLWITPEITTSLSTGGLVYSLSLIDAVARLGEHVTVVGLGRPVANELADVFDASIRWLPIDGTPKSAVRTLVSPLPHAAAKTATPEFRRRVRELLNEPWDVVVLDSLQSIWATPLLAARHPDTTAVYISQNHETSMRSEVASAERSLPRRALLRYDVRRLARLESMTVAECDIVSAITDRDFELFAAESSDTSFVVVPPGWSGASRLDWPRSADRPRRVGIMGSFDWHVKQEGLRRFLVAADRVFADAECELVIAGMAPEGFRKSIEPDLRATRFVGWVDDPGAFLDSCRLGVISESLGGGFKLKALDYVFNHVPLACLEHCTAGLPLSDGVSMFTAADEAELAVQVVSVIDDPARLDRVAEEAYDNCVEVFDWSASATRLIASVG